MKRTQTKYLIATLVIFVGNAVLAVEEHAHTPAAGSAERQAIMDAVRADFYGGNVDAAHRNAKQISLKVGFFRVHGDWACTSVIPVNAAGKELEDPRWVLLRRKAGRWADLNYFDSLRPFASEEDAQDALAMSATTVRRLCSLFPYAPEDIFPDRFNSYGIPVDPGAKAPAPVLQFFAAIPISPKPGSSYTDSFGWHDPPLLTISSLRELNVYPERNAVAIALNENDAKKFAKLTREFQGRVLLCRASDASGAAGFALRITKPIEGGVIEFRESDDSAEIARYLRKRFGK